MRRILEICVDNSADFDRAVDAGAHRIELCATLELEGLTPEATLLAHASGAPVETVAMLRNRGGDFVLTPRDHRAMLEQARVLEQTGVSSVVLGGLTPTGAIDLEIIDAVHEIMPGVETVCHRAFDRVRSVDRLEALDQLVGAGVTRVLSAGGAGPVRDGLAQLRAMRAHAGDRCNILAGGGLRIADVAPLLRGGITEIHASARPRDATGALAGPIDVDLVRRLRLALDEA